MRYCVMIDEKLKIAEEKANEVLDKLNTENCLEDSMVSTKMILRVVQQCTNTIIGIAYTSFSDFFGDNKALNKCGAMMSVYKDDNDKQIAKIVVNADMEPEYQRFSLVHELGHLMTGKHNIENKNSYKLSAHINQNVFSIAKTTYDNDEDMLNEQIANVFALKVLIPFNKLIPKISKDYNIEDVAAEFGVKEQAIISRIALGE